MIASNAWPRSRRIEHQCALVLLLIVDEVPLLPVDVEVVHGFSNLGRPGSSASR